MYDLVPNMGQIPPCDGFKLGHQNDGAGHLWCVLANTPHGQIPAKAKQNKAWYPFGGKEHETRDFQYVRVHPGSQVTLEKAHHGAPPGTVTGHQRDSGTYYMVICHHTSHGKIPGKSNGRTAWYSYGGKEHETRDFSYVVVKSHHGGFNPGHHHGGFNPGHHHGGFNPGHHHGGFNPGHHHGGFNPGHHQPAPHHLLTPGAKVRLTSKAHGKNLRIHNNGAVDGSGGTGEWATFAVQGRGPHIALSLANHPNKFLAIKNNMLTHGAGGKFCTLIVKHHQDDGTVSLESAEHRSQHVGILPNGHPKGPHQTGTGDHGKFYVNFA